MLDERGGRVIDGGGMLPRWLVPMLALSGVLVAGLTIAMLVVREDPALANARRADPGLEGYRIPEFSLVDQNGEPAGAEIFDGRYTILDFIFTNCPFVCPGMNAQMARLHDLLRGTGVRFVSITVDPQRDTPERLREYAGTLGADTSRWTFLTGSREATWSIARDALDFDVSPDETRTIALDGGDSMVNINHPSKLILIGPDRGVLGLYSFQMESEIAALEARARLLAGAR